MWNRKVLLIIVLGLSVSYSFGQAKIPNSSPQMLVDAPGNIKLLPGYFHERRRGIDSAVGSIANKNGFSINYDIGRMAGNYTATKVVESKETVVWQRRQKVNNDDLLIAYFKDGRIMASYYNASANFSAETNSQEDIIDFLLMILTYNSIQTPTDKKAAK